MTWIKFTRYSLTLLFTLVCLCLLLLGSRGFIWWQKRKKEEDDEGWNTLSLQPKPRQLLQLLLEQPVHFRLPKEGPEKICALNSLRDTVVVVVFFFFLPLTLCLSTVTFYSALFGEPFFWQVNERPSERASVCHLYANNGRRGRWLSGAGTGIGTLMLVPWTHGWIFLLSSFFPLLLHLFLLWGRHAAQFVRGRQNAEATVKAGRKPADVVDEDDDCAHDFFFGFSLSPSLTTNWRRLREMKKKKKKCLKCRHTHTVAQSHSGVKCEIIIYSHFFFSPPAAVPSPPVCYWRSNSGDRGGGHWQYSTYTHRHTHFKMKMKRMKEEEELDCSALAGCCHFVDN